MELDILDYCRRAIGEFTQISADQGRLAKVEKDVPLLQHEGRLIVKGKLDQKRINLSYIPKEKLG